MSKSNKRKKISTELQPKKKFFTEEKKTSKLDESKSDKHSSQSHGSSTTPKISPKDLEFLKQFDLDMTYGPCTGITRRERYERAIRHELNPPARVMELVEQYPNDREVTHNLWRDYTL